MSYILNLPLLCDENERWKIYEEVLWQYLHFIQETQKRNGEILAEDENENNDMRGIANETTFDNVFVIFCENCLLNVQTLAIL